MKRLISLLSLLLLFVYSNSMQAQESSVSDQLLKPIVHPSPQSAAYARYGEYPVDHSTGVPKIEIPLYTLDTGDYRLPVSLSYHASGIKALDVSGPVGLGWVLNAGGVISRTACAVPDHCDALYRMRFKNKGDVVDAIYTDSSFTSDRWNRVFSGASEYDSESDRYSYNFAGKSGLFRYDVYTDKPFTIPYEPLQIERTDDGFEVTDTDGSVYTFEATELCTPPGQTYHISSWYLTKIVTGDRRQTITLSYDRGASYTVRYRSEYLHEGNVITFEEGLGNDYVMVESGKRSNGEISLQSYLYHVPLLQSITWNDVTLSFRYASDRMDVQRERLVSMEVSDGGRVVKHVTFGNGGYFGSDESDCRLKLSSLTLKGDTLSTDAETYAFAYNPIAPPPHYNASTVMTAHTVCMEDYWGYYNGRNTYSMIPAGIFDNGTGWADRSVMPEKARMCSLTRITYPTGGSTLFEMESNRIDGEYLGGLRVKSITNLDSDGTVLDCKEYAYTYGWPTMTVSPELFYYDDYMFYFIRNPSGSYWSVYRPHRFAVSSPMLPLTGWSGSPVFYRNVTEYAGTSATNTGKTEYVYGEDFESSYPGAEEDDLPVPPPLKFYSELYNNDEGIVPALLEEKTVYKNVDGEYVKQLTEQYSYAELSSGRDSISVGVRLGRMGVGTIYYENNNFSSAPYPNMDIFYDNIVYSTVRGYLRRRLLTHKTVTDHETGLVSVERYVYDGTLRNLLPVKRTTWNSDGVEHTVRTVYPYMLSAGSAPALTSLNRLDLPLRVEEYADSLCIGTQETVYGLFGGRYLPQSVKRSEDGSTERTAVTYHRYDSNGNPEHLSTHDGREIVILWGHGLRYPSLWIEGAGYDEVAAALGEETLAAIAENGLTENDLLVSRLSTLLPDAQATVYCYTPSVGLTGKVLPNRLKERYTYDSLGRLQSTGDNLGTLESHEYNYAQ